MQTTFKKNPRQLYATADSNGKKLLEELLGPDYLTRDICELVTSFEDACLLNGTDPNEPRFTTGIPGSIAYNRCAEICKALRDGVVLSFSNKQQRKYFAVHEKTDEGFRFWFASGDFAYAFAPGGSALCLPDERRAVYFGKNFIHEITPFYEQ